MKKVFISLLMCFAALQMSAQTFVDLGLPSGTKWATTNLSSKLDYFQATSCSQGSVPTKEQFDELIDYCDVSWNERGCKFVGSNGKSLFFPAEGIIRLKSNTSQGEGEVGVYWTSSINSYYGDTFDVWVMSFSINEGKLQITTTDDLRKKAFSVRLVQNK